jgi:3-hydroxyisobutyrate dehydrogenase-like beta-hydroxyacid dehydrogenase
MRIGVIGLGIIGSRMAANWKLAGHDVIGWNRTRSRAQDLGLAMADSPRELAARCDVMMLIVGDPASLHQVVDGPGGIATGSLAGKIVMNATTVGAEDNLQTDVAVRNAGGRFLETPFTGSKGGAEAAKLVFYVGGDDGLMKEVEPLLLQIGVKLFHFGPVGSAADAKLVMNMMLANLMLAMAEGFAFARKAGLNMKTFVNAYRMNAGWSVLADMKSPKMLQGDYSTHFSLKHMDKDIRLALERAHALGVSTPLTRRLKEVFDASMEAGMGEDDFSTLYRLIERQSGLADAR